VRGATPASPYNQHHHVRVPVESDHVILPLGDDNTGRIRTPFITYALIAVNVLVFVLFQGFGTNDAFTNALSTVPQEIRTGEDVAGPTCSRATMPGRDSLSNRCGVMWTTPRR
jgi:hypothetical protein